MSTDIKVVCNGKEYKIGDSTNQGPVKMIKIDSEEAVFFTGKRWVYFKDLK